jgi:hypothetical protein
MPNRKAGARTRQCPRLLPAVGFRYDRRRRLTGQFRRTGLFFDMGHDMAKSPTSLARELLEGETGGLDELRIHEFSDDESAHDDELTERLYAEFSADFDRAQAELTKAYGEPSRAGTDEDEAIPLNGVFRFAVWEVGDELLFAAAAHEDRGCPILLMLGTAESDAK